MKKTLEHRIKDLEDIGYEVNLHHERNTIPSMLIPNYQDKRQILPRGGRTIAQIVDDKHELLVEGIALCSLDDNYNKRIGGNIALGRAEKKLNRLLKELARQEAEKIGEGAIVE